MTSHVRFTSWSPGSLSVDAASWTSPMEPLDFRATEVVASWNATTPPGTWLEIEARAVTETGETTRWFVLGRWTETDLDITPTSVPGQGDAFARVDVDVLAANGDHAFTALQVRVTGCSVRGGSHMPTVRLIGVMASRTASGTSTTGTSAAAASDSTTSDPAASGVLIDVPTFSQQVHRGEYPEWDGGGASWCSPTAVSMLLAHWRRGPTLEDYAWVDPSYPNRFVAHAARHTFDEAYGGAGNWSFSAAYAARFGLVAYVTRLRGLDEAELFLRAGIPLAASVSFRGADLDGAGYDTSGHLLVIVGIDEAGNVICNDPASHGLASDDEVRTTFRREQLQRAWLEGSGGITYVIHPADVRPPAPPEEANWRG